MTKFRASGKWRSDGPARTNTVSSIRGRIGPPIPLADDVEFPMRSPGTGIATPLGMERIEKQLLLQSPVPTVPTLLQRRLTANEFEDSTSEGQSTPTAPQPSYEPPPVVNQPAALRTSMTGIPYGSSEGRPQRKKSSLRSVFGRLFGKKRKNSRPSNSRSQSPGGFRAGQHRSDPTALSSTLKISPISPQRSVSLPVNEFDRALRSHSAVDEKFPTQNGTNRESILADGQTKPRRATDPALWTAKKVPGYPDWTGLSPRPSSIHGRGSKMISDEEAEAAVGIAITSGSHPNRRSRSVGELRAIAPSNIIIRRRSDEIKYWRESYDPGLFSPMSSNKPEAEESILVEPEVQRDGKPQEQPQPFNFGPMGEMAGMKITQAASLETRVQRLEERMLEVEHVVSQMRHRLSTDALILQDPPKRNSKRDRSRSANRPRTDNSDMSLPKQTRFRALQAQEEFGPGGNQKRSSSYGSSRPSTVSTHNSYHPSFDNFSHPILLASKEQTAVLSTQTIARPLSTSTTIRGLPSSSPTIPTHGPLTGEHYSTLANMVLAEQAGRQHLESVVRNLQQQLYAMTYSTQPSYPILNSGHEVGSFKGVLEGGEFSTFEHDDSSDDEGRHTQDDAFQMHDKERRHFGDEIFGEVNGINGRDDPRTLSLSQLTLGNGLQPRLDF